MTQEQWTAVDGYLNGLLVHEDAALSAALESSAEAGLPTINVAPNQGKLLAILAQAMGARRILEIGTLGAYSTIWLARILPQDGRLVTLEANSAHAEVARRNLDRAGLSDRVELRLGLALDTLPLLAQEGLPPFDFVFIDADKVNTAGYWAWALKLTRPGSMIVVDNVLRRGHVMEAESSDPNVQGMRQALAAMAAEPRVTAVALQTVGSKGYDGLAIALVTG